MPPLAIVLFMTGMVALLVGAARATIAIRTALLAPEHRRAVPAVAWSVVSVYGLVLASIGMLITR